MKQRTNPPFPDLFVQNYELILAVMGMIQHDIRHGGGINGNCHSVARAMARMFPNFRVVDGYIPRLAPPQCGEEYGVKALVVLETTPPTLQPARWQALHHSWLAWKGNGRLIVDPWPIGGGYGFAPPLARWQDQFDILYVESDMTGLFDKEQAEKDAEDLYRRIQEVLLELFPANSQKAA